MAATLAAFGDTLPRLGGNLLLRADSYAQIAPAVLQMGNAVRTVSSPSQMARLAQTPGLTGSQSAGRTELYYIKTSYYQALGSSTAAPTTYLAQMIHSNGTGTPRSEYFLRISMTAGSAPLFVVLLYPDSATGSGGASVSVTAAQLAQGVLIAVIWTTVGANKSVKLWSSAAPSAVSTGTSTAPTSSTIAANYPTYVAAAGAGGTGATARGIFFFGSNALGNICPDIKLGRIVWLDQALTLAQLQSLASPTNAATFYDTLTYDSTLAAIPRLLEYNFDETVPDPNNVTTAVDSSGNGRTLNFISSTADLPNYVTW